MPAGLVAGSVKLWRPGVDMIHLKDQAIMSNMTYYQGLPVSAILRHITGISNKSNLPYSRTGSGQPGGWFGWSIVAQTTVAYATIFEAMRRVGRGRAGWQAAKNLSGFQKSARCGRVLPVAGYHAQDGVSRQALLNQFIQRNSSNFSISSICVKSATFCIISAMRGQA